MHNNVKRVVDFFLFFRDHRPTSPGYRATKLTENNHTAATCQIQHEISKNGVKVFALQPRVERTETRAKRNVVPHHLPRSKVIKIADNLFHITTILE